MAGMSKYLALALYDMALNPVRSSFTPPDSLWIALHTAQPSDSTYGNEGGFGGYLRQPMNSLTMTVGTETAGELSLTVTNGAVVQFPASTGPGTYSMTHWAIWDTEEVGEGNMLVSGALSAPQSVGATDVVLINAGGVVITLT